MRIYPYIIYVFILFSTNFIQANNNQVDVITIEREQLIHKKDLKVLILIIASDGNEAYLELQKIWRTYMHNDPQHFDVFFIRGNPELATPYEIKGDNLFVKTEENYTPGIINKTVLSMEALLPRLKDYDYVIRTNLSSFYVFPRLLVFLNTLPKQKCYCGVPLYIPADWYPKFGHINFVSGAGIILSSDLAEMLAREKEEIFKFNMELADDVLIGWFFQKKMINLIIAGRNDYHTKADWIESKGNISKESFHFRAKHNPSFRLPEENFADEIYIDHELLNMFYSEMKCTPERGAGIN